MADMTLEEALEAATVDEELISPVNEVLMINPETRTINVPDSEKMFGVRQDMSVERKYFKCPRIVGDNIDLFEHYVFVNYIPSDQNGKYESEKDVQGYWCKDLAVEGDFITFSWELTENVLRKAGYIAFAVYAKVSDENGNLKTKWHTTIAIGNVLDTLPDGEEWITVYPDIVTQLLERMDAVEKIANPESMQEYIDDYFNRNPMMIDRELKDSAKAAPADIVGKLSEDIADLKENGTGTGNGATTAQANSLWAIIQKSAFAQQLTDAEINKFKTSWGIGGDNGEIEPDEPIVPEVTPTYYSITNNLTNVQNTTNVTSVEENKPYSTVLTIASGYTIQSAKVTMGGVDVTSQYYNNGTINIPNVTGNIVITVVAVEEQTEPSEATLTSISATYSGGNVEVGTNVNSLRGIVVTANYDDGTSQTVTNYTLSGTINEGSNTITVSYKGMTTTFTVVGVVVLSSISVTYTGGDVAIGTSLRDLTGITVTATYSNGSTTNVTDFDLSGEIVEGSNIITVSYEGKTTTFIVVGIKEEFVVTLPEGYSQLEYLQSDGAIPGPGGTAARVKAYINTGYLLDANDDLKVTFATAELNGVKTVLGARDSVSNFFVRCPNESGTIIVYKYGTTVKNIVLFKNNNLAVDEKITLSSKGNMWSATTDLKTDSDEISDNTFVDCSEPLYLFCENNKGVATPSYAGKIKIYDVEITNGGTMKAKFVPCKDASGVACMYECVSGQTLYNAGVGEFIIGGNVS